MYLAILYIERPNINDNPFKSSHILGVYETPQLASEAINKHMNMPLIYSNELSLSPTKIGFKLIDLELNETLKINGLSQV